MVAVGLRARDALGRMAEEFDWPERWGERTFLHNKLTMPLAKLIVKVMEEQIRWTGAGKWLPIIAGALMILFSVPLILLNAIVAG